jgi:endonuclease/exonuclease/phosphatase (EEP) superfamily protein YafD
VEGDTAERYPHRFGIDGRRSDGIAIWSRLPLGRVEIEHLGGRAALVAPIRTADGTTVHLMAVHAPTPTDRLHGPEWAAALRSIAGLVASRSPVVVVGDLNATRWHPAFRSMLRAGLRDAHELRGRGLSVSWPIGGRVVPPLLRLDHALLDGALELVALDDVTIPGSDHRGFVVTVQRAAP